MITLGNQKIKDVFIGSQPIKAIYQGANLIWQRITKVLRTVTGGNSVTLTNCNDDASLVLLELNGASGGSGDKTENLCADNWTQYGSLRYYIEYEFDVGTYTLSTNAHTASNNTPFAISINKNSVTGEVIKYISAFAYTTDFGTFTITEKGKYYLVLDSANATYFEPLNANIDKVRTMLVSGSYSSATMPPYEPYGHKISVLSCNTILNSDNVIKRTNNTFGGGITLNTYPESMTYTMNGNGSTTAGVQVTTRTPLRDLGFKPNINYTIEARLLSGSWSGDLRTYVYLNGAFWKNIQFTQSNKAPNFTYTFTEADMSKTFGFNAYNAVINGVTNVFDNVVIQFSIYESNKTPISLPCYIGSTPLLDSETVTVDFENKVTNREQNLITKGYIERPINHFDAINFSDAIFFPKGEYTIEADNISGFTKFRLYWQLFNADGTKFSSKSAITDATTLKENYVYCWNDGPSYLVTAGAICNNGDHFNFRGGTLTVGGNGWWLRPFIEGGDTVVGSMLTNVKCYASDNPPQDLTNLNTNLLNAPQTTFEGTTVLTDTSTNKVSAMSVDYYASK